MKSIKERAEEYANEGWTLDEANFACEDGYIKGATELIDKACEWLKKQEAWDALNDKPCPMFSEEDINEFKLAMKGE